jgi:esterase/lipase superfamily enzyme
VVAVLFSWPSSGGTWFAGLKYTFDENAAARSSAPFAELLADLLGSTEAPVTVMAHSMGSRVVADALIDLERRDELSRPLADLVLAAPDIDVSVFARRYLDTTLKSAGRLTVYCANDDRALSASRSVHGGYDRLGSCREAATVLLDHERVEIVDASKLWVSLLDHDKVASSPRLLADLQLLVDGVPASERALVAERDRYVLPP